MILFPCHAPEATCPLPHPRVKKPEKGEVRIPCTRKSRTQTVLGVAGPQDQTLSHRQRVAASQGTRASLGLELREESRGGNHTSTHTSTHLHTWGFTNPHLSRCLSPRTHQVHPAHLAAATAALLSPGESAKG